MLAEDCADKRAVKGSCEHTFHLLTQEMPGTQICIIIVWMRLDHTSNKGQTGRTWADKNCPLLTIYSLSDMLTHRPIPAVLAGRS